MYIIITVTYVATSYYHAMVTITEAVMVHYLKTHDLAVADSEMMIPNINLTSNPGIDLHANIKRNSLFKSKLAIIE